ncbi:LrgB family protein [Kordiimonas marina]|uniref:LrgB family protein n=1 Tax=Kordiimonas marina TaxID=2872312 RepID=UPI001FF20F4C|nr:LrgB family protein [Kordiimonas marina]MCJ9429715.1 LrgB family protein [Kordiimonas marina]
MMPALWFFVTLGLYAASDMLFRATGRKPWLHPVLLPVIVLAFVMSLPGVKLVDYQHGTATLHHLLMAAVAALALPLYRNAAAIRQEAMAVSVALVAGSISGVGSALAVAFWLKAPATVAASLANKSITTPLAITVAQAIGGIPALAAAVVIVTGLVAAIIGPPFLKRLGVDDDLTAGLALGTAGHALGMAEAASRSDLMGAAAAFAMAANGLATAFILPLLWSMTG